MPKINVAIVHGIGINTHGYAEPLIKGISRQFNRQLQGILNTSEDYAGELNFIPVIWDDIVAFQEAVLADIFKQEFDRRKKKSILEVLKLAGIYIIVAMILYLFFKHWLVFLVVLLTVVHYGRRLMHWLRTNFASEFIGDITSYNDKGTKDLILQRIEDSLKPLSGLSGNVNLSFISHSLGTVIASDFVWERQKPAKLLTQKIFLSNFFTMGSPLPLFSLQFGGPDIFTKPISIHDPQGRWVNIYDKDDPIAYPLKPLNDAYDRVVLKDREINTGMFGIAHIKYWDDSKAHSIISRKLALDWLRLNNKLDKTRLDALYAGYDKNLSQK